MKDAIQECEEYKKRGRILEILSIVFTTDRIYIKVIDISVSIINACPPNIESMIHLDVIFGVVNLLLMDDRVLTEILKEM